MKEFPFTTLLAAENAVSRQRSRRTFDPSFIAREVLKAVSDDRLGGNAMVLLSSVQMPQLADDLKAEIKQLEEQVSKTKESAEARYNRRYMRLIELIAHLLEEVEARNTRKDGEDMVDLLLDFDRDEIPPADQYDEMARDLVKRLWNW